MARFQRSRWVLLFVVCLGWLSVGAVRAETADLDFGLPLFGLEEIRLEREKAPDFNLSLLKKYLAENENHGLAQMAALFRWVVLIRLSDEPRAAALKKIALDHLRVEDPARAPKQAVLNDLLLRGLLLAADKEPDPKNVKDHELEDALLKAEDLLADMPEYHLVKGILFHLLRSRPNEFFAPMRPLEDLKKALAMGPSSDPHFFYVIGQAFRLLGTQENSLYLAIGSLEKAAALVPANGKLQNTLLGIYMGLHESYQNLKKPEPFWLEEAVYKKILTLFPNNPHALNNLGFLYAEYGLNRELAQSLCQRAVDRLPENASFRDSLGWAAFKNQQYDKAEAELLKSIELNPDVYEPYYHLGTLYYVTHRYDKAIAQYDKALQIKPEAPETLNNYAYLLSELDRDIEKALAMATKAVKLEPSNASYIDTLGWVYFRLGKLDEAHRYLQKALQLSPDVAEILVHLGKVYLEQGKFNAALDYIKQAHRVDPRQDNLEQDLYLAITLKAHYGALEEYHRLFGAQVNPEKIKSILLTLIGIYQGEGQYSQAIRITRMCEALKRGELDLSKPLFNFYQLDQASGPVQAPASGEPSTAGATEAADDGPAGAAREAEPAMPDAMPEVADAAFAIHFGPVIFEFLASRLVAFPGFEQLAMTILVQDILSPSTSARFDLQMPQLDQRDPLAALDYYLRLFGAPPASVEEVEGGRRLRGNLGRIPIWAFHLGDHLVLGFTAEPPPVPDVKRLEKTFPYDAEALMGLYVNWNAWEARVPRLLLAFLPNPFAPFRAILSHYQWNAEGLHEASLLVPGVEVNPGFMKALARDLYAYKVLLLKMGFAPAIQVKAREGLILIEADYGGVPAGWRERAALLQPLWFVLQPRWQAWVCALRRVCFGGTLQDLPTLCPAGGVVTVSGPTGTLECSVHRGPGLFPLPGLARDRCAYSCQRLTDMFQRLSPRVLQELPRDELLKKFLVDYNIPSCPTGGVLSLGADGKVGCSFHRESEAGPSPEPVSAPAREGQTENEQTR